MMTPQIKTQSRIYGQSWCIGPHKGEWDGVELWGHPGGNISGGSRLFWIPGKDGVLAVTINNLGAAGRFYKVMFEEVMEVAFGISRPRTEAPSPPLKLSNPERYVGNQESVGVTREVTADGDRLLMTTDLDYGLEKMKWTVGLIPLGGDRFLIDMLEAADPLTLPADTAFWGDDGNGRATNMLNGVFPLRRKE